MLVYLAGPLFSDAERTFNEDLTEKLEAAGFDVFLPQRDGVERHRPPYDAMSPDDWRRALFDLDEARIHESDVFLFVLDGRVPDEGACVELGIAHAHRGLTGSRRLLVGLHTDDRAAFLTSKLNPMVRVPLDLIAGDEEDLIEALKEHRRRRGVQPPATPRSSR